MRFDWYRFCIDHGIHFVEQGANVSRGNVNIQCPFCQDTSEHLGLSLDQRKPSWGCWRCKKGGLSPGFLVGRLLRCSQAETLAILKEHDSDVPDDFDALFDTPQQAPKPALQREKPLPQGLRRLDSASSLASSFLDYLKEERGFDDPTLVATRFDLHYALTGDYARRIVMPVYIDGKLISWVGRAVGKAVVRYKTDDSGDLKKVVANWSYLMQAHPDSLLLVGEGPFDYMKLAWYGEPKNIQATCTFGTSYTQAQVAVLVKLVRKFRKTLIVYDQSASVYGAKLAEELTELSGKQVGWSYVRGCEDPGAMKRQDIRQFEGL